MAGIHRNLRPNPETLSCQASYLRSDKNQQNAMYTYFLKFLIMSLKFHSHACILTARMPPITSFITSSRSSVTDAAFSRSLPAFLDSTEMYVITTKKKPAPTRACQPIRCQSSIPDDIISIGANTRNIILQPASLRRLASFETRLIV